MSAELKIREALAELDRRRATPAPGASAVTERASKLERGMRALMGRLASLLDEDQFKDCEDIVRRAGVMPAVTDIDQIAGKFAHPITHRFPRPGEWVEWIEPYGQSNEAVHMRMTYEDVAKVRRKQEPRYTTDQEAVEDFCVVHWAKGVAIEETKWRCFHCDETFTTVDSAIEHFGRSERQSPACQIDIAEYRAMELRMEAYNAEDADIHREMHAKLTDHQLALVREGERGYSRGLRDAKRNPGELGLQPIPTQL